MQAGSDCTPSLHNATKFERCVDRVQTLGSSINSFFQLTRFLFHGRGRGKTLSCSYFWTLTPTVDIITCNTEGLFNLEVFSEAKEEVWVAHSRSRGFSSPTVNFSAGGRSFVMLSAPWKPLPKNIHLWQLTAPEPITGCKCARGHSIYRRFPAAASSLRRGRQRGEGDEWSGQGKKGKTSMAHKSGSYLLTVGLGKSSLFLSE